MMKSKKSTIVTVLVLFLFILSPGFMISLTAQTQDAADIVKKCVAAMGGETALKNFTDFKGEGEVKASFGTREFSGTYVRTQKGEKFHTRVEIQFGSSKFALVQAFDGKVSWMDRMGTIADRPALNAKSDADHTVELLLKKDAAFTLDKETEIEGKKAVGIVASYKGKKTTFFIDKEAYTILEIVFKDEYYSMKQVKETIEKRTRYKNYKKKGGMLFPYTWVFYSKGKKAMEGHFKTITFNPQIPADTFARPDQELDLRTSDERLH
jgi:outer membrane lipoprotein-sorting protein